MDVFALTRALVDIPSVTEDEAAVGVYIEDYLGTMGHASEAHVERMPVDGERFNVLAWWGDKPTVTFSTHMDTVPPFFPSWEDNDYVYGRGSCDAKGILACMIKAVEALLNEGVKEIGILVVVGEERGSAGAIVAGKVSRGCRYLINGEPTENHLALASKGALRLELVASGKMAHSAYPELGESAIDKLLDALELVRSVTLPVDALLGSSTMNIGVIQGGRAPNIIPDSAKAEILIRLVDDGESTRKAVTDACHGLVTVREVLCIPAQRLNAYPGFATTTVSYTSDIPALVPTWGEAMLLGPGSIHVAHTPEERVPKSELLEAISLYSDLARKLLKEVSNK